jgi:hypothetical protein
VKMQNTDTLIEKTKNKIQKFNLIQESSHHPRDESTSAACRPAFCSTPVCS